MKIIVYIFLCLLSFNAYADYSLQQIQTVTTRKEAQLESIRDNEIQQLRVVLSRSARRGEKADLLLRLAEIYSEKYKFIFYKENEIWNKKIDSYLKLSLSEQKRRKRPKADHGRSKKLLYKSTKELNRITKKSKNYRKMDEVYYYLGFNNWELKKKKTSINFFNKIVNNYPNSRYAPEAYRYIADDAFSRRRFQTAKRNYRKAASFKNEPSRPRVLYGLAWTYYKLRDYRKARATMLDAIRIADKNNNANKSGLALNRDAFDGLVLFYAESGRSSDASNYFTENLGKKRSIELLQKLAHLYQRQGRYGSALKVNKQLVELAGDQANLGSARRYDILLDGYKVSLQKGQSTKQLSLLKTLVAEYVTRGNDPDKKQEITLLLKQAALRAHKLGNKSKRSKRSYKTAAQLYQLYLSAAGSKIDKDDFYEIHYYLGDVYSRTKNHRQAAAEFRLIVQEAIADPNNKILQKYKKDASEGLIFSLESYFGTKKRKKLNDEELNQLVSAIDSYLKINPKEKNIAKFRFRTADMLLQHGRFEEAKTRFMQLIQKFPKSTQAYSAASLMVKESEKRKDWNAVVDLTESFLANSILLKRDKKGKFRKQLENILARAKFKAVRQIEKSEKPNEAAKNYENLATESKDKEVRFKALNNAAINFAKAGDDANADRLYKQLAIQFPKKSEASDYLFNKANELFLLGKYSIAAKKFEEFYELYEKNIVKEKKKTQKRALLAIENAAYLRKAIGDNAQSIQNFKKIIRASNKKISYAKKVAEQALFDAAERMREDGNIVVAVKNYKKYIEVFPKGKYLLASSFYLGLLYGQLQDQTKANAFYKKVLSIYKRKRKRKSLNVDSLAFVAQARLQLIEPTEKEYLSMKLQLPEKKLKKDINLKLKKMEQLNKAYLDVIEYGNGYWAMDAFYRIAMAYKSFADSLESAPVPNEYSEEEKAKFRTQLQSIAKPVRVKVVETLENALKRGESLNVVGESMANIFLASALYSPNTGRFPLYQSVSWNAENWMMGPKDIDIDKSRLALKKDPKSSTLLIEVGNWHLLQNQTALAKIFYLRALELSKKSMISINNLAFIEGKEGNIQKALAGFKKVLRLDEFKLQSKLNMAKIYMNSGLWRHANLAYRQVKVRSPKNSIVLKGLGLSYLALGKIKSAKEFLDGRIKSNSINDKFASAILELAEGNTEAARKSMKDLKASSKWAKRIVDYWKQ